MNDAAEGRLFRYNLDDNKLHLVSTAGNKGYNGLRYGQYLVTFPPWNKPKQTDLKVYDLVTNTVAMAAVRTSDVMEPDYGTSWTVNEYRKEIFVFGQQKKWGTWFNKFYLIDLSFLPLSSSRVLPRRAAHMPVAEPPASEERPAEPMKQASQELKHVEEEASVGSGQSKKWPREAPERHTRDGDTINEPYNLPPRPVFRPGFADSKLH